MCRGLAHETRRPSVELLRLSDENGVIWFDAPEIPMAPLMIATRGQVPAGRCLVLRSESGLKPWLKRIHTLATDLQILSLRVFLPTEFTVSEARQAWRSLPATELKIEFTPDEESAIWPMQFKTN
jgi:hypothetical protein